MESENLKINRLLFFTFHITCPSGGGPSSLRHAPHHLDTRHSLLVRLLLRALSCLLPRSSCLLLTILTSLAGRGSGVLTLPIGFGRNRITLFLTPNFTAQPVPVSALRNSSKLMDGKERGGERRKIHTKEKATQVWPGLWWQSPLRTQRRAAGWPGLATSPEGPRSAGCRCCPSLGSPRPQRWAPCPRTSQASRPSAPSYNGAGHPAPRKCNARFDLSTKKAVKVFKEQLPFSKGLTPLTFFLVFQSKT